MRVRGGKQRVSVAQLRHPQSVSPQCLLFRDQPVLAYNPPTCRSQLPFPCLWEPKKELFSQVRWWLGGRPSQLTFPLPPPCQPSCMSPGDHRQMEGWGQYLSVTGECRHRGWVSSTSGDAPLQRFSMEKKQLKQAPQRLLPLPQDT